MLREDSKERDELSVRKSISIYGIHLSTLSGELAPIKIHPITHLVVGVEWRPPHRFHPSHIANDHEKCCKNFQPIPVLPASNSPFHSSLVIFLIVIFYALEQFRARTKKFFSKNPESNSTQVSDVRLQVDKKNPWREENCLCYHHIPFVVFSFPFALAPTPSLLLSPDTLNLLSGAALLTSQTPTTWSVRCLLVSSCCRQSYTFILLFFRNTLNAHTGEVDWEFSFSAWLFCAYLTHSLTGNCGTMGGRRRMRTYSSGSENEWMKLKCCSCWTRSHWLFTFNHFSSYQQRPPRSLAVYFFDIKMVEFVVLFRRRS